MPIVFIAGNKYGRPYRQIACPSTTVRSGSLDGAEMMPFFRVPCRLRAPAPLVKCPVASITICAPTDDHLISAGSLILKTLVDLSSK